jgi:hypothetical protein
MVALMPPKATEAPVIHFWFFVLAAVLAPVAIMAQARNAHWALAGVYTETEPGMVWSGMDGTPAMLFNFTFGHSECSAAISDTAGQLVLFASKQKIYRANGEELYQSLAAWQNGTVSQGQLFLPRPGDADLYDLIMIDSQPDSTISSLVKPKAIHLLVDAGNAPGSESLVGGEVTFGYNLTERLTGTPHANGSDYWILMHEWKSDKFLAHQLSSTGLDTIPVVSHAGAVHSANYGTCETNRNRIGEMKFSYAGDKVAICSANMVCGTPVLQPNIVQLFRFNDTTGEVSYWMTLLDHLRTYGIEFSQDGSKLYIPGVDEADRYVDQYDLSLPDTTSIQGSRTRVFAVPYNGELSQATPCAVELAPNGKIYVSHSGTSLDVIQWPDLPGSACGYEQGGLALPSPIHYLSHTNQIKRYHDSEFRRDDVGLGAELKEPSFAIWPNPATSSIRLRLPENLTTPRVRIHDNTGRLLRKESGHVVLNSTVDVSSLASGMYTVSLLDGGRMVGKARLVVQ